MKPMGCSCSQCKRCRRSYHPIARAKLRGKRALVKRRLRQGIYDDLPTRVGVGYAS